MKKQYKAGWLVLTVIVVVAAVALAVTNTLTKEPINQQNMAAHGEALAALFPESGTDGENYDELTLPEGSELGFCYTVKQNGQTVGYAGMVETQGYGGPIEVVVGLDTEGSLRGISVGGSGFKETEGLGSKTKDDDFTGQFVSKAPPVELNRDIDAISGATISSRAVVDGVNKASELVMALSEGGGAPSATEAVNRSANASKIGYAGPVLVSLTLDDKGAITRLSIGGERFSETDGVGSKVREERFTGQFIGKTPPLSMGDIDAVSGATVSSQAALDAINAAAQFLGQE